ncbi:MAG: phosphate acyltransferase PlsX [Planctomycetota bacterium]|jgi:glycerol-3-phosphate acyltransferase PlsX
MRIALESMGGDLAPAAPVEGAIRALGDYEDLEVVLVGDRDTLETEIGRHEISTDVRDRLTIEHAPHVAKMTDDPVRAVRADERNTARVCAEMLRDGAVQGVVNMGSTGAAVAAATLFCGRLSGVRRPGIAVPFPRRGGGATVVIDAGANPDARPEDLRQYAVMARHYVRAALEIAEPRVGILSIGEEEHKGNRFVHETWTVFRKHPVPNFVGNVEPREFYGDKADVVVGDGFAGNVALKAGEGMAEYLLAAVQEALPSDEASKRLLRAIYERVDYAAYGGAPLLGVKGAYMVGHGRSDARAVHNALRSAHLFVSNRVAERIVEELAGTSVSTGAGAGEGA